MLTTKHTAFHLSLPWNGCNKTPSNALKMPLEIDQKTLYKKTFYTQCRNFLIESVKQIMSQFDSGDKLKFLSCLAPASANAWLKCTTTYYTSRMLPTMKKQRPNGEVILSILTQIQTKIFKSNGQQQYLMQKLRPAKNNPTLTKVVTTLLPFFFQMLLLNVFSGSCS